jgi:hypothetical protein
MEIIPVIDLKGGLVVRARMGQRDQYRPIETPLSPTSHPADVVQGLMSVFPFRTLYVADLDAIEGTSSASRRNGMRSSADSRPRFRGSRSGSTTASPMPAAPAPGWTTVTSCSEARRNATPRWSPA